MLALMSMAEKGDFGGSLPSVVWIISQFGLGLQEHSERCAMHIELLQLNRPLGKLTDTARADQRIQRTVSQSGLGGNVRNHLRVCENFGGTQGHAASLMVGDLRFRLLAGYVADKVCWCPSTLWLLPMVGSQDLWM